MKKLGFSLALVACLSLTAATCAPSTGVGSIPAPLAATVADEKALITADRAFSVALDVVNLAVDVKLRIPGLAEKSQPFIPGTDAARQLASSIRSVDASLNRAATLAAAGNCTASCLDEYKAALEQADDGISIIQTILKNRN